MACKSNVNLLRANMNISHYMMKTTTQHLDYIGPLPKTRTVVFQVKCPCQTLNVKRANFKALSVIFLPRKNASAFKP